jgi:hypothetical protein
VSPIDSLLAGGGAAGAAGKQMTRVMTGSTVDFS